MWKEFKIKDLFIIEKVYGLPLEKYNQGNTPYISTSSINNGNCGFVEANNKDISLGNCITVDPIKGKCFYHPYDFVGRGFSGASINILRNSNLNEFNSKYIIPIIEKNAIEKASYGNLFNSERLKNAVIKIPCINEMPDWKYLEEQIKLLKIRKFNQYLAHIEETSGGE